MTCSRPGFYLVSSTNKTDRHDITEILLKVALNTIALTNKKKQKVHEEKDTMKYKWKVQLHFYASVNKYLQLTQIIYV